MAESVALFLHLAVWVLHLCQRLILRTNGAVITHEALEVHNGTSGNPNVSFNTHTVIQRPAMQEEFRLCQMAVPLLWFLPIGLLGPFGLVLLRSFKRGSQDRGSVRRLINSENPQYSCKTEVELTDEPVFLNPPILSAPSPEPFPPHLPQHQHRE